MGLHGLFRKNIITGKCEVSTDGGNTYTDLTDRHVNSLWKEMCKEVKMVRSMDMRALLDSDLVELYNPFTAYFNDLPEWDRHTDPIAKLAAQVHIRTGAELFPLLFKKWLVAMVASLLHEEVVNHEILVLLGRQGIYKTTWLNHLLPPELQPLYPILAEKLRILSAGIEAGELKGKDFIPSQALALSTELHPDAFPSVDIDWQTAIAYLRKEAITLPAEAPRGYVLLRYQSRPLGFVKNLGNRANNLYPAEWRIRSGYLPEEGNILNI